MLSNVPKVAAIAALVTGFFLAAGSAAAVDPTGACCHLTQGCCDAPVELSAGDPRGVPSGQCRIETQSGCNGILDTWKGVGTTCEEFCPSATTTTTLPTGACCHLFNGCCGAPVELQDVGVEGGVGGGECRASTAGDCNGIADTYKGDGTTCEELCPIVTTTTTTSSTTTTTSTTTTLPTGACCEPLGTCLEVTEQNCVIGVYQGDGTACMTVECTQPTTTTMPDTTTTSTTEAPPTTTSPETTTTTEPLVVLCGDANGDGDVTSVDALIALRTSVGIAECPETRCDYNGNGQVQTSDALAILRVSVGQVVVPMCPVL